MIVLWFSLEGNLPFKVVFFNDLWSQRQISSVLMSHWTADKQNPQTAAPQLLQASSWSTLLLGPVQWCLMLFCFMVERDVTIWLLFISNNGSHSDHTQQHNIHIHYIVIIIIIITCCGMSLMTSWETSSHYATRHMTASVKCWLYATVNLYAKSICGCFEDRLPQHALSFCWHLIKSPISSCYILTLVNLFIKDNSNRDSLLPLWL